MSVKWPVTLSRNMNMHNCSFITGSATLYILTGAHAQLQLYNKIGDSVHPDRGSHFRSATYVSTPAEETDFTLPVSTRSRGCSWRQTVRAEVPWAFFFRNSLHRLHTHSNLLEVHGSALHGDRCTAGCEAHTDYADESVYLTADNVCNFPVLLINYHVKWVPCHQGRASPRMEEYIE
jgi:hypothetical protein